MASKTLKKDIKAAANAAAQKVEKVHHDKAATPVVIDLKTAIPKASRKRNKKVGKKALRGPVSNYLAAYNPYLLSVADPFRYRGARIPDPITTPSSVFTLTQRYSLDAQTYTSMIVLVGKGIQNVATSYPGGDFKAGLIPLGNSVAGSPSDFTIGQVLATNSTTAFDTGSGTIQLNLLRLPQWQYNDQTIPRLISSARLVSAGISLVYAGAPLVASGVYTTAGISSDTWVAGGFNQGITFDQVKSLPSSSVTALNNMRGVSVRYLPTSTTRNDYVPLGTLNDSTANTDGPAVRNHSQYLMAVMVNGLNSSVGTQPFELIVTLNYEGIPRANSLSFIETSVSVSDPIALAHASNLIEELPPTIPTAAPSYQLPNPSGSGTTALAPSTMVMSQPDFHKQPTGPSSEATMNMNSITSMLDGLLTEGPKLVDKVMPLVEKYGPVLAEFLG